MHHHQGSLAASPGVAAFGDEGPALRCPLWVSVLSRTSVDTRMHRSSMEVFPVGGPCRPWGPGKGTGGQHRPASLRERGRHWCFPLTDVVAEIPSNIILSRRCFPRQDR